MQQPKAIPAITPEIHLTIPTFRSRGGQQLDLRGRSHFETAVMRNLKSRGTAFFYEPINLVYTSLYKPDILLPNGILVEVKGLFDAADRHKLLSVRENNPSCDIRLLFQRDNRISSTSRMRYSDWCKKHGFQYHIGAAVPESWLLAPPLAPKVK